MTLIAVVYYLSKAQERALARCLLILTAPTLSFILCLLSEAQLDGNVCDYCDGVTRGAFGEEWKGSTTKYDSEMGGGT